MDRVACEHILTRNELGTVWGGSLPALKLELLINEVLLPTYPRVPFVYLLSLAVIPLLWVFDRFANSRIVVSSNFSRDIISSSV